MLSSALATGIHFAAEEAAHPLPAPPWVFGVGALTTFMVLLGVTWAFRSVGNKH